jgi:hypothetical protein
VRQAAVEPARERPGPPPEQLQHGGQQQAPDQEGIYEHAGGEAQAEQLQDPIVACRERPVG